MPNRRDIPNWAFQPLRLMVLLVILAAVFAATSGCRQRYAKEVESSVPTVTVVGTYDGCKVTKEVWTSKKGNTVGEYIYLEKDGYVLRLYDPKNRNKKRSFRMGRADIPKPDYNRFIGGVFTEKPLPQELLSDELRQAISKVNGFSASLSASSSDIVAATAPWMGDALNDLSGNAFEPVAQVEPELWLAFDNAKTGADIVYELDGPWWLLSYIVLEKDKFTIYVDTRDYTVHRGAYQPQKGTAVIRGTYGGKVSGGRIEGTDLSDYRTGLLREAKAQLKAIIPFAGSKLYGYPKLLAERCRLVSRALEPVSELKWDDVVPPSSILKTSDGSFSPMSLSIYETTLSEDTYMSYIWSPPNGEIVKIRLHKDGTLEIRFMTYHFDFFMKDGDSLIFYEHSSPGERLTGVPLKSLTMFIEAVDAGLIKIPMQFTAAYKQLKEFIADPTLPKRRKAVDFEKMAQDLLDELK